MQTILTLLLSILITIATASYQPTCPENETAYYNCSSYNLCETCNDPLCGFCQNTNGTFCGEWNCMTCISGYSLYPHFADGTGFCYDSFWDDYYSYYIWYWNETFPNHRPGSKSAPDSGDGDSESDSQTIIIIILACALVLVICCIVIAAIMYFVYRRGVKKGIKKATATGVIIDAPKVKQGETSNMDIFNGESEEVPPAAYNSTPMASIEEQQVDISPRQSRQIRVNTDTVEPDQERVEGDETAFEDINPDGNEEEDEDLDEDGPGAVNVDKEQQDYEEKKDRSDDSDTMEMYENNDAAEIAMPDDKPKSVGGIKSGSIDSNGSKEEIAEKLKIKNVDSLDDLYEPEENETAGQITNGHDKNEDVTIVYKD